MGISSDIRFHFGRTTLYFSIYWILLASKMRTCSKVGGSVPQEGTFFHVMRAFPLAWPRGGANGSREELCKVDEQTVINALKRWTDMQLPQNHPIKKIIMHDIC